MWLLIALAGQDGLGTASSANEKGGYGLRAGCICRWQCSGKHQNQTMSSRWIAMWQFCQERSSPEEGLPLQAHSHCNSMPKKLRLGSLGWTCEFVCIHFSQLTTCKYHFLFHIQLVSFISIGFLLQEKEVVKMATELLKCEASQMLMMRKEEARTTVGS